MWRRSVLLFALCLVHLASCRGSDELNEFFGPAPPRYDRLLRHGPRLLTGFSTQPAPTSATIRSRHVTRDLSSLPIERSETRCTTLLPHVLPSPDQREAGSCLYMAITAVAEIALGLRQPTEASAADGNRDLSERYAMALGVRHAATIGNWRTDSILLWNKALGGCLNRHHRYTKGWYFPDGSDGSGPNGQGRPAPPEAPGARYGTYANWVVDAVDGLPTVPLPHFRRSVLFHPQAGNQWSTGCLQRDGVQLVKRVLREENRPILAIYNHFGHWHCVVIVGYDDGRPAAPAFVERFCAYMTEWADKYQTWGNMAKAQAYRQAVADVRRNQLEPSTTSSGRGVFFVRDSIYSSPANELYDYDPAQAGEESPYATAIIERDYTWLMHLVNHLVVVHF